MLVICVSLLNSTLEMSKIVLFKIHLCIFYRTSPVAKKELNRSAKNACNDEVGTTLTGHTASKITRQVSSIRKHKRDFVRQYRPGYQWNLGGRVKELRIRCGSYHLYHYQWFPNFLQWQLPS